MGGCCGDGRERDPYHEEIEDKLSKEKKKDAMTRKLLLLGAGSSGKSTLLKQMKFLFIHGKGFPEEESLRYKQIVHNNILQTIHTLCYATQLEKIPTHLDNQPYIQTIMSMDPITEMKDMSEYRTEIISCWNDEGIQSVFANRHALPLLDNAPYFMTRLDRILQPEYVPTFEDVVRTRTKTTGIIHERFYYEAEGKREQYLICDVGGQRTERQKWVKCFDDVIAIIFVIALSGYNQVLFEDATKNRFEEAFELFHKTTHIEDFQNTNFIVFLNKNDLFLEKIRHVPFTDEHSMEEARKEYHGDPHNPQEVISWITERLEALAASSGTYFHVTTATDTGNIESIFAICHDIFLREALNRGGLL